MKKVKIIAAHPDDEVLGCAGTVARLVKKGYKAYTLILGEGITSRYKKPDGRGREKELEKLKRQAVQANKILGVKEIFLYNLPDNMFDKIPLLNIVKIIENVKDKIKPDIVFTHYEKDLNIDHQITYKAVITATRPAVSETVKEIYSFEILSSTEWSYPLSFSPDVFFDISTTLQYKLKAMNAYRIELRNFPHPRSLKGIELNAKYSGMRVGLKYAESFRAVRIIK